MIICPDCSRSILKAYPDQVKLRASIVIFKGDKTYAVCKKCNKEVEIPAQLTQTPPEMAKLYVNK